ncbi:SufS family cysteine desulfurase [Candidatus Falkowbacteria bacterium]|nr:SufS family cysteine desulfurase [Candidatus Falkowbacteria bacterium]
MILNTKKIKKEFALYKHKKNLVYLDFAATALTPDLVTTAMNEYYEQYNANVHRGVHEMSMIASEMYERARRTVADFIGADTNEIVFTSGATAALNALALGLEHLLTPDDSIVLSRFEHHSNLVPWLEVAKRTGAHIRYLEITSDGALDLHSINQVIDESTKIVSVTALSNTLGTLIPLETIISRAQEMHAYTIIDAAQMAAHHEINVKKLGCDFLVFAGHKVYGPTGAGVMYGRMSALTLLEPSAFGGGMISHVSYDHATWGNIPFRFEAGTPNIAGALGLAAAIQFLQELDMHSIGMHVDMITKYAHKRLKEIPQLRILGPQHHTGIISFVVEGAHAFDIGTLLDQEGVAVRTGHHCTQPLLALLGVPSTVRISCGITTSQEDIDECIVALTKAIKMIS